MLLYSWFLLSSLYKNSGSAHFKTITTPYIQSVSACPLLKLTFSNELHAFLLLPFVSYIDFFFLWVLNLSSFTPRSSLFERDLKLWVWSTCQTGVFMPFFVLISWIALLKRSLRSPVEMEMLIIFQVEKVMITRAISLNLSERMCCFWYSSILVHNISRPYKVASALLCLIHR